MKFKRLLTLILLFFTLISFIAEADEENNYTLSGEVSGSFNNAKCHLNFNKYGKTWILRITPETGFSPAVNLFFSPKFGTPSSSEYPVKFDYRGESATMGASVTNKRDTYSYDSSGTVNFTRFDDRVTGSFSYTTNKKNGPVVTANGAFDCARGDALK